MSSWSGWSAAVLVAWLGAAAILAGDPPAAGKGLTLEVRVVGIEGNPVEKSSINLWRLVPTADRGEEPGGRGRLRWREAGSDRVWEAIGGASTGDRLRQDGLAPGTYRATGHLGHHETTPVGVGEPVSLVAGRETATITLRLRPGPTVAFRLVDAESHRPIPGVGVGLVREGSALPPWSWRVPASDDRGQAAIEHLPPGTYTLDASRRADRPEELEYTAVVGGRKLVVAEGRDQVVEVPMAGRALAQAGIERRWGWVATGRVVDESGGPVADAEVRVATGWGTLRGGGSTRTGAAGQFILRFAEGVWSQDPANTQAAVFSVEKGGLIEKSRSRPGNLLMARQMPQARDLAGYGGEPDRVILRGRPYPIDFVLAEPAIVEFGLDKPAESLPYLVSQDESDGRFAIRHDEDAPYRWVLLPGRPWRFEVSKREMRATVRSLPFTLPRAGRYRFRLRYTPDPSSGVDLLEIVSVTGPVGGREIRDKVVGDDPMARPPVAEALQRRGQDLLRRMAESNRPWLGPMPEGIETYEYRFRLDRQEGQTFRVDRTSPPGAVRRAISYASPVRHLASNPTAATFRQVEVGDDRIVLTYTLKEPIGVSAGNGVQRTWRGFFSMPFSEGVLVLDARRLTPLETRSKGLRESFSQYVEVEPGRFAPLAIRVGQGEGEGDGMGFDWTFQVVEPKLWLFATSESDAGRVIAQVDRVRVNGTDAKPIARGVRRTDESE